MEQKTLYFREGRSDKVYQVDLCDVGGEQVATILALLCTEPEITSVELDDAVYHVARSERFLPQGAPTSPAITNLMCRRLDQRLTGASNKLGFRYTRYADDLTFSARGEAAERVGKILSQVEFVVAEEGFAIHPDKTRVFRKGRRQEVTGLVVNERLAVPRHTLRRFRALLFQIEHDGPDGKRWGAGGHVLSSAMGFANFVSMVEPARGAELVKEVRALMDRYGGSPPTPPPPAEPAPEPDAPAGSPEAEPAAPKKRWWKLF